MDRRTHGRYQRNSLTGGGLLVPDNNHNKIGLGGSTHATSPSKKKKSSSLDYDFKNARDALIGSISAVINFLRSSGVPKPS